MNKYFNIPTKIDGITFASRKEAHRYTVLRDKQKDGEITKLELQPKFKLQDSFKYLDQTYRPIHYIADFKYIDVKNKIEIIEDVKGSLRPIPIYELKKKLFLNIIKNNKKVIFREIR